MREKKIYEACQRLPAVCPHCGEDESILTVTNEESMEIGVALWDAAKKSSNRALVLMNPRKMHREEPTDLVAAAMLKADVILRATTLSLSHSYTRRRTYEAGARDLNCCNYDFGTLEKGGLYTDPEANRKRVGRIAKGFVGGDQAHIVSALKADYYCSIKGRKALSQYGMSHGKGQIYSLPDIECATGAVPGTAHGKAVVDGSTTHPAMGLLRGPITLYIENSLVTKIEDGEEVVKFGKALKKIYDPRIYRINEIGIGLNPDASPCGRILEDEGCMGCVRVALGNNETDNQDCLSHVDMVFRDSTIEVDGGAIFDGGKAVLD